MTITRVSDSYHLNYSEFNKTLAKMCCNMTSDNCNCGFNFTADNMNVNFAFLNVVLRSTRLFVRQNECKASNVTLEIVTMKFVLFYHNLVLKN